MRKCVMDDTAIIRIKHTVDKFPVEFSIGSYMLHLRVQCECRVYFIKNFTKMVHLGFRSIFINYYILQIASAGSPTNNKKRDLIEHLLISTEDFLCKQIKSMLNLSDEFVKAKVKRNLQLVIMTNFERTVLNIEKLITSKDITLFDEKNYDSAVKFDEKTYESTVKRNYFLLYPTPARLIRHGHPIETFVRTPETRETLRKSFNDRTLWSSSKYADSNNSTAEESRAHDTNFDEEAMYQRYRKAIKEAIESSSQLVVIIHGWNSHSDEQSTLAIAAEILEKPRVLVAALECGELLSADYFTATRYVNAIGDEFGASLANITEGIMEPSKIYIIGHSLGAHIASVAGKAFKRRTGSELGRITALDPAKPCYTNLNHGLTKGDATFVDVIHTNAGFLGIMEAIGDADFYPNGGSMQPGCFLLSLSCYHLKSWEYFAQSVNKEKFIAVQCPSWAAYTQGLCAGNSRAEMGYHCSATAGTYFLTTSYRPPPHN